MFGGASSKMMTPVALALLCSLARGAFVADLTAAEERSVSEYVNLLTGSFTKGDQFSTGNTQRPTRGSIWNSDLHFERVVESVSGVRTIVRVGDRMSRDHSRSLPNRRLETQIETVVGRRQHAATRAAPVPEYELLRNRYTKLTGRSFAQSAPLRLCCERGALGPLRVGAIQRVATRIPRREREYAGSISRARARESGLWSSLFFFRNAQVGAPWRRRVSRGFIAKSRSNTRIRSQGGRGASTTGRCRRTPASPAGGSVTCSGAGKALSDEDDRELERTRRGLVALQNTIDRPDRRLESKKKCLLATHAGGNDHEFHWIRCTHQRGGRRPRAGRRDRVAERGPTVGSSVVVRS